MRTIYIVFLFLLTSCVSSISFNSDKKIIESSQLTMKNLGFAYCLNNLPESKEKRKYAVTNEDFNTNDHIDPAAYIAIKDYIKANVKPGYSKDYKLISTLQSCTKIYNSEEYNTVIKQQKKYISLSK